MTGIRGHRRWDRLDVVAAAVSVILHAAMAFFLPGLGPLAPRARPRWVEVTLVEPPVSAIRRPEPAGGLPGDETGGASVEALGNAVLFPAPPVWLPQRLAPAGEEPIDELPFLPGERLPHIAGTGFAPAGYPQASAEHDEGILPAVGTPPELGWKPRKHPAPETPSQATDVLAVEGPASNRRVLYRPPPPHLTVKTSGFIRLKFWVHPDGTVGKIVPEVRGDSRLEEAAIAYLEKWRFEPAPTGTTTDQWGVLPIRFKMK